MNEVSESIMAILRRKAPDLKNFNSSPHSFKSKEESESLIQKNDDMSSVNISKNDTFTQIQPISCSNRDDIADQNDEYYKPLTEYDKMKELENQLLASNSYYTESNQTSSMHQSSK